MWHNMNVQFAMKLHTLVGVNVYSNYMWYIIV